MRGSSVVAPAFASVVCRGRLRCRRGGSGRRVTQFRHSGLASGSAADLAAGMFRRNGRPDRQRSDVWHHQQRADLLPRHSLLGSAPWQLRWMPPQPV
jgi:hypothetical protein